MLQPLLSDPSFWAYFSIGFAAQIVDGALGMAYGTLCTAILVAMGVPPATVSAGVHSAQFFTSGLSGLSHTFLKNVDRKLLLILTTSGITGGVLGALLLAHVDAKLIRPWVSVYLLLLGLSILWKVLRRPENPEVPPASYPRRKGALGFAGGFLDAIGGGWGPIMTSSLLRWGVEPRIAIGTVNTAEFFVKTVIALTLTGLIGLDFYRIVLGLMAGGILAAPLGAFALRLIRPQILMVLVGVLIIALSLFGLGQFFLK